MNGYDTRIVWNALKTVQSKKMPVKLSFAIARNITILAPVIHDIDEQQRKIIQKYFVLDDEGKPVMADDGGVKITDAHALEADIGDLLEEDTGVELRMIAEELFEKCDEDKYDAFTPSEIADLRLIIEEKEAAGEQHTEHKLSRGKDHRKGRRTLAVGQRPEDTGLRHRHHAGC